MKTKLYNSYIYLHLPRTFIEFLKHRKYLREYIKVFISNMPLKVTVELICRYSCKNDYDTMDTITSKILGNYKYNKYFTRENQAYLKNILTLYYFWLQTANYTIFHSR